MTHRQLWFCSATLLAAVLSGGALWAAGPSVGALVNAGTGTLGTTVVPAGLVGLGPVELQVQGTYSADAWSAAGIADLTLWSTDLGPLGTLAVTLGGYGAYALSGQDSALGYGGRATVGLSVPLFGGLSVFARAVPAYGLLQQATATSQLWHVGAETGVSWSLDGGQK